MFPFLTFTVFNQVIRIPMYGLCMALGIYVAFTLAAILVKRKKLIIWDLFIITACVIGFGIAGARILFVVVSYPIKDFFRHVFIQNEGLVFYGGLIFGPLGYFLGCKIAKINPQNYIGIFSCAIPIAHGFGRIGCFCGGCCYGIPYNGIFAVQYTHPLSSVSTEITVFPVQLLETILLFVLGTIIFLMNYLEQKENANTWGKFPMNKLAIIWKKVDFLWKNSPIEYRSLLVYLGSYSIIRFLLEFLRGDKERGNLGFLSTSQIISLVCFLLTVILTATMIQKNKRLCLQKVLQN